MPGPSRKAMTEITRIIASAKEETVAKDIEQINEAARVYGHDMYSFSVAQLISEFFVSKGRPIILKELLTIVAEMPDAGHISGKAVELSKFTDEQAQVIEQALETETNGALLVFAFGLAIHTDAKTRQVGATLFKKVVTNLTTQQLRKYGKGALSVLVYNLAGTHPSSDNIGISNGLIFNLLKQTFVKREETPQVLLPILFDTLNGADTADRAHQTRFVSLLEEIGPIVTSSRTLFHAFLSRTAEKNLSLANIASMVVVLVRTSTPTQYKGAPSILEALLEDSHPRLRAEIEKGMKVRTWSHDVFVDVIDALVPNLDWNSIFPLLDMSGFKVNHRMGLNLLLTIIYKATKRPISFDILFRKWNNVPGQLSLLEQVILAPPESVNISQSPRRTETLGEMHYAADGSTVGAHHATWRSIDLVELLLIIAKNTGDHIPIRVRTVFSAAVRDCPETLLITLASVTSQEVDTALLNELVGAILPAYLNTKHPDSPAVLRRLFDVNSKVLIDGLIESFRSNPNNLSRILDVVHELKAIPVVLADPSDYNFVIDLAVLAFVRQYVNLAKWLNDMIEERGHVFADYCLAYLERRVEGLKPGTDNRSSGKVSRSTSVLLFFRALHNASGKKLLMPPQVKQLIRLVEQVYGVYHQATGIEPAQIFPAPAGEDEQYTQSQKSGAELSTQPREFPENVVDQADDLFKKTFSEIVNTSETLSEMRRLKDSHNQVERQVHACIVQTILNEYKFFHQYPENKLVLVAELFGKMINGGLFREYLPVALNIVLEALCSDNRSRINFGVIALKQYQDILPQWLGYSKQLAKCGRLAEEDPPLYDYISLITKAAELEGEPPVTAEAATVASKPPVAPRPAAVPEKPTTAVASDSETWANNDHKSPATRPVDGASHGFGSTLPLDTVVNAMDPESGPTEEVQDRIAFIFNNVCTQNLEQKAGELKNILEAEYYAWFCQYVVVRRVSVEENQQGTYLNLLEVLGLPRLYVVLIQVTLVAVKALLASPKICTSTSERKLLKNLGLWLGSITFARNKVILQKDLDLRKVLIEAYEKGKLVAVVPFVRQVLAACAQSKLIRPPNPWVMSMMGMLNELYSQENLRLNIRFEIEMLSETLNLELSQIKTRGVFVDRKPESTAVSDFYSDDEAKNQPPRSGSRGAGVAAEEMREPVVAAEAAPPASSEARSAIPAVSSAVPPQMGPPSSVPVMAPMSHPGVQTSGEGAGAGQLNLQAAAATHDIMQLSTSSQIKPLLQRALDNSIRDVITPVVQRASTIAQFAALSLIRKDFAFESDGEKMRVAARSMASSLAANLALATCREPLRVNFMTHLSLLVKHFFPEVQPKVIESLFNYVLQDAMEQGALMIEKASAARAVGKVDEALASQVAARRQARSAGQRFVDTEMAEDVPSYLPEELGPSIDGLRSEQERVYSEFKNLRSHPLIKMNETFLALSPEDQVSHREARQQQYLRQMQNREKSQDVRPAGEPAKKKREPAAEEQRHVGLERLNSLIDGVQHACSQADPRSSLADLPSSSRVKELLHMFGETVSRGGLTRSVYVGVAGQVLAKLFERSKEEMENLVGKGYSENVASYASCQSLAWDANLYMLTIIRDAWSQLQGEMQGILSNLDPRVNVCNPAVLLKLLASGITVPSVLDTTLSTMLNRDRSLVCLKCIEAVVRRSCVETGSVKAEDFRAMIEGLKGFEKMDKTGQVTNLLRALSIKPSVAAVDSGPARVAPAQERSEQSTKDAFSPVTVMQIVAGITGVPESSDEDNKLSSVCRTIMDVVPLLGRKFRVVFRALAAEGMRIDTQSKEFKATDGLCQVVIQLASRHCREAIPRLAFVREILEEMADLLANDFVKKIDFDQKPFFRFYSNMLYNFSVGNSEMQDIQRGAILCFGSVMHSLRPTVIPAFSFAWMHLISHRMLIPKMLSSRDPESMNSYHDLVVDMLTFIDPFVRMPEMPEFAEAFYRGTARLLLVLFHDFADFLCGFHLTLCNAIPPEAVQLRNLILSAFPKHITLPDPMMPNLKVDLLEDSEKAPVVFSDFAAPLESAGIRSDVDMFLDNRVPQERSAALVSGVIQKLTVEGEGEETVYSAVTLNSLVFYIGCKDISLNQARFGSGRATLAVDARATELYRLIIHKLNSKGRYLFFSALANQLRYPSQHTHYFSCTILLLFASDDLPVTCKEILTRVLLERLLVNRPHPWGTLITFIELMRNQQYDFWRYPFIQAYPEVRVALENLRQNCFHGPASHAPAMSAVPRAGAPAAAQATGQSYG